MLLTQCDTKQSNTSTSQSVCKNQASQLVSWLVSQSVCQGVGAVGKTAGAPKLTRKKAKHRLCKQPRQQLWLLPRAVSHSQQQMPPVARTQSRSHLTLSLHALIHPTTPIPPPPPTTPTRLTKTQSALDEQQGARGARHANNIRAAIRILCCLQRQRLPRADQLAGVCDRRILIMLSLPTETALRRHASGAGQQPRKLGRCRALFAQLWGVGD